MSNEVAKTKEEIANKAIDNLMSDRENLKKIFTANSYEEMKEVFRSFGLEVTDKQLDVFKKTFADSMSEELQKLPAEEREKLMKKVSESDLARINGGTFDATKSGLGKGLTFGLAASFATGTVFGIADLITTVLDAVDADKPIPTHMVINAFEHSFKTALGATAATTIACGAIGATDGLASDLKNSSKSGGEATKKSTPGQDLLNFNN